MNYRGKNHFLDEYGIHNPLFTGGDTNMKKIKAHEVVKIDEGKHEGKIMAVVERNEKYEYLDVIIRLDDERGTELKAGFPPNISEETVLGRLLQRFGQKVEVGREYDIEHILKGKSVSFMTINEKTEKGTFARIVKDSIKPL